MKLSAEKLCWGAGGRQILHDVSIDVEPGCLTVMIGPNGCGKTSLLHVIAGLRPASSGQVFLNDRPLADFKPRSRAKALALVEQHASTELDLSVRQVVELGRIPHRGHWPGTKDKDPHACAESVEVAGVSDLLDRRWQTLSGGERQRVQLARALSQRPQILLLDEPTNHLDLAHQLSFMETVSALSITTVAVMHDLDLAAAFGHRLIALSAGRVVATGTIDQLTPDLIEDIYGVCTSVTCTDRRRVTWHRT